MGDSVLYYEHEINHITNIPPLFEVKNFSHPLFSVVYSDTTFLCSFNKREVTLYKNVLNMHFYTLTINICLLCTKFIICIIFELVKFENITIIFRSMRNITF